MKILILILISFSTMASYLPESKFGQNTDGETITLSKSRCEKSSGEQCFHSSKNTEFAKIIPRKTVEENNIDCVGCEEELSSLECSEGFTPERGLTGVHCEKVIPKHVGIDEGKKAIYDAKVATQTAIETAKKLMVCGKNIQAYVAVLNAQKGWTIEQTKLVIVKYATMKSLLDAGAIDTFRSEAQNTVVDEYFTESDKTLLINEANKCLGGS